MLVTNKLSASVTHDLSDFIMIGFWESWSIGLDYRWIIGSDQSDLIETTE